MAPQRRAPGFRRLDDEQRARVRGCLGKASIKLPLPHFERFVRSIEASIARFRSAVPRRSFREAHDALRSLWRLCQRDDVSVGQVRARLHTLPKIAREQLERRARAVLSQVFPDEDIGNELLTWANRADGKQLLAALHLLLAEGGQIVHGRNRGGGKRSRPRLEPMLLGVVRGGCAPQHIGGAPVDDAARELVMHLAVDWLAATEQVPPAGRRDSKGFADLVHSVFQWLNLPSAEYGLRRYWKTLNEQKKRTARMSPEEQLCEEAE